MIEEEAEKSWMIGNRVLVFAHALTSLAPVKVSVSLTLNLKVELSEIATIVLSRQLLFVRTKNDSTHLHFQHVLYISNTCALNEMIMGKKTDCDRVWDRQHIHFMYNRRTCASPLGPFPYPGIIRCRQKLQEGKEKAGE